VNELKLKLNLLWQFV